MSERRKVVISGIGPVTPIGTGVDAFWDGLRSGRNGVVEISRFDHSDLPVSVAGEVRDFVPTDHLDLKEARRTDPFAQYAIASAKLAWADAGNPEVVSERGGAVYATGIGGVQTLLNQHDVLREKGPGRVSPFMVPMLMANAGRGAHRDDVRPHRTELLHGLRVCVVQPRDRRGHAAHPRRLPRPLRGGRLRGRHRAAHRRRVRPDDGAHQEPGPGDGIPPVRRRPQRLRAERGRLRVGARVRGARRGARRAGVRRGGGLRRLRRRAPHHRAGSQGLGGDARDALGAAGRRRGAFGRRLRERARHVDPPERRGRERRHQGRPRANTPDRWRSPRPSR